MKARLGNQYTRLQQEFIGSLAKIEQEDADRCAGCGGEDCICCEYYHDRQKWVVPMNCSQMMTRFQVGTMTMNITQTITMRKTTNEIQEMSLLLRENDLSEQHRVQSGSELLEI